MLFWIIYATVLLIWHQKLRIAWVNDLAGVKKL